MIRHACFITVLLAPALAACGDRRAPAATAADSAAVTLAYEQYRQAWLRGDTAAALARVSKDIRILISGVPDIVGFDATRKLFVDEIVNYEVPLLNLNHQDVIVSGDHAIVIGRYEEIQVPKTGAPVHGTGRYMTIWRREGGEWRIVRYMLNELP